MFELQNRLQGILKQAGITAQVVETDNTCTAKIPIRSKLELYREPKYNDITLKITNRFGQEKTILVDFAKEETVTQSIKNMCKADRPLRGCCSEAAQLIEKALNNAG